MRFFRSFWCQALIALAGLALLVVPAYADEAQVQIDQVRATEFPSITVQFTVTSPRGAPLPDLKAEDFVVTEDGQPVNGVSAYSLYQSPTPLALVLAMDTSGSMNESGNLDGAKKAAKAFVSQLRPVDEIEIISFGDKVGVAVPFTHNRNTLLKGIDNMSAAGDAVFFDATYRAVSDVMREPGNRLVVLITDGQDMASRSQLAPAIDLARQTQVPVYTVGLGSNVSDDMLTRIATDTSGRYFKAPHASDLTAVFGLLSQTLANRYELTYFSRFTQVPGKKVNVAVQISPDGYTPVTGNFSYVMPAMKSYQPEPVDPGALQKVAEVAPVSTPQPLVLPVPAPNASTPVTVAVFAFGAFLAVVVGLSLQLTRDPRESRLTRFLEPMRLARRRVDDLGDRTAFRALIGLLARAASRVMPANQVERLRQNLILAGSPNGWGVEEFLGVRMLVAIVCAAVGYLYGIKSGPSATLLATAVMGLLGFLLPTIWLGGKIRSRQREILRAMPNALDLISVTVEAGLGFDQALSEVCQKWQNELTREFAIFLSEVQLGRDRREAMRGIVERTGVAALNGFVSAVIQADELGTGIARTLTIQAEQVRMQRRQQAEKLAHEAAIKMVFPMVFLIFPSIFVVILGPAIPSLVTNLGHLTTK
jgi:tight adherence protein C